MTDARLVEFLTARLDEDEQVARAADSKLGYLVGAVDYWFPEAERDEQHAVRHAPGRVLAEVDAKRQLLADHPVERETMDRPMRAGKEVGGPYWPFGCGNCHADRETGEVNGFGYCLTQRLLALPYANHPDYDEAWRP